MMVSLKRISTALGLLAATAAVAQAQGNAPSTNQATANAVAGTLRASRALSGHRIEVETRDGLVTLTGSVATMAQKAEAIGRVQQVAGVSGVVDRIKVTGDARVQPVQYQVALGGHRMFGGAGGGAGVGGGDVIYDGAPMQGNMVGPGPVADGGPVPEGPAGGPGATQVAAPGNPNYSWPSYAPYPNFSAVGYPTAYPWQAWPNIAAPYPYPEVPLDWRAVTLRWDDGIWWLDFKKHYTRPFFTPYPFGIFAY
jgi:hypothetical protein